MERSGPGRRHFLGLSLAAAGLEAIGGVACRIDAAQAAGPAGPRAIDIRGIPPGSGIKVAWGGQPVFIRHLTSQEVAAAQAVPMSELRDPESLEDRTTPGHRDWLVVIGVCPHMGCTPLGAEASEPRGRFGGFLCPCHGSQFDTAGRVRAGPAPSNLVVPPHMVGDGVVRLG